ncbi:HNS binding protein [Pectobacterium phage PcCB251]|uniref:HNS binding protein n=1 Tax=Pectobacterium phage PcCB251 TaxID=2798045 RepID=A0AAE7P8P3_9CAUD|nr:HNS binding protein [Pectobacterium phage PcCB251]
MAITKRFKVSFEVTAVITSEGEEGFTEELVHLAKRAAAGEKISPRERELLVQSLTYGVEGAISFAAKHSIRNFIRTELPDDVLKVSPATVREVK